MTVSRRAVITMLVVGSVATAASNSGNALISTLVLGPDERGVMVIAVMLICAVVVTGRAGTGTALRARLPQCRDSDQRREVLTAYSSLTLLGAPLIGGVAVLLLRITAEVIDPRLADPRLLAATFVSASTQMVLDQLNDLRFAEGQFGAGALWSTFAAAAGFAGLCLAVLAAPQTWVLLLAQAVGFGCVATVHWRVLRRHGLVLVQPPQSRTVLALVRQGTPSLGVVIGLIVSQRADRYILGAVAGTASVGVYSLSATISGLASLLPIGISQLAQRDAAENRQRSWPARALRQAIAGTAATAVVVGTAAWFLLVPVFGPEFRAARALLVPLLIAEVCIAPFYVASRSLLGGGWIRSAGAIGLGCAMAAVVSYGVAVPHWRMTGAALASALLYFLLSLTTVAVLRRKSTASAAAVTVAVRPERLVRRS